MSAPSAPRPRHFQFTLASLLVAIAWAALFCMALRTPTRFWTGTLYLGSLVLFLTLVLVAMYRPGRTRASAAGFLVFALGYLLGLALVAGSVSAALRQGIAPGSGAAAWLFDEMHPPVAVQIPQSPPVPGGMGGGMFSGAGRYWGPTGQSTGSNMMLTPSPYDPQDFAAICNLALSCLLGAIGGAVSQWLYATRRSKSED